MAASGPSSITGRSAAARDLRAVAEQAGSCERCDLHQRGTQTVFGEGPVPARAMLVGEQPGDREDLDGHPFVGPAGRVLDDALRDVGTGRRELYVTNAVKHFKWTPRGKRRIHQNPNRAEVVACSAWLASELELVQPELVVLLGATAAKAQLGAGFRVTQERGRPVASDLAEHVVATVHPSSILRGPEDERADAYAAFVDDLRAAFALLA